jgi:hypothetical protein
LPIGEGCHYIRVRSTRRLHLLICRALFWSHVLPDAKIALHRRWIGMLALVVLLRLPVLKPSAALKAPLGLLFLFVLLSLVVPPCGIGPGCPAAPARASARMPAMICPLL